MSVTDDPVLHRIARFWDARGREDARRYSVPGGSPIDEAAYAASGDAFLEAAADLIGWTVDASSTVVDIGCGAGRIAGSLAARVDRVVGYDISRTMLAAARDRLPDVPSIVWRHGHAADLHAEEPASFSAALLLGVLAHLPDPDDLVASLSEASRVVEPGGAIVFDLRTAAIPLRLPGEETVPPYVSRHPLWQGRAAELETIAAVAHQEGLEIERIAGSETGRCLVLARSL